MPSLRSIKPFRLFRLRGIEVFLDWSWLLVALVQIQFRPNAYHSQVWKLLEYLTLFAIVLLHEFGHALACRSVGGTADRIVLWPLGGVAYVNPPPRPGATLWSIAAGPLVNVALVPVTVALALLARTYAVALPPDLVRYAMSVAVINIVLLAYNILPIYPLDGGQMLRSLLWYPLGRARSLRIAAMVGFAGAAALAYFAFTYASWWFGLLAAFNVSRSYGAYKHAAVLSLLEAMPRREGYHCPFCAASPPRERIWRSPCGNTVDAFAGPCFRCGDPIDPVGCPDCGRTFPAAEWEPATVEPTPSAFAARPFPDSFTG